MCLYALTFKYAPRIRIICAAKNDKTCSGKLLQDERDGAGKGLETIKGSADATVV